MLKQFCLENCPYTVIFFYITTKDIYIYITLTLTLFCFLFSWEGILYSLQDVII